MLRNKGGKNRMGKIRDIFKKNERQGRKGKVYSTECRVPENSKER